MPDLRNPSVPKVLFVVGGCTLVLAALWVRFFLPMTLHFKISQEEYKQMEQEVLSRHGGPELTSSVVPGSDALGGLGADWTYLEATELTGKEPALLAGTRPLRQARIKTIGKNLELSLHEAVVTDVKEFQANVKSLNGKELNLAGRKGFVIAPRGVRAAFLIQGETNVLLISSSDPAFDWTASLPTEIASYIATVNVP